MAAQARQLGEVSGPETLSEAWVFCPIKLSFLTSPPKYKYQLWDCSPVPPVHTGTVLWLSYLNGKVTEQWRCAMHDRSPFLQLALQMSHRNIFTDGEVCGINRKFSQVEDFLLKLWELLCFSFQGLLYWQQCCADQISRVLVGSCRWPICFKLDLSSHHFMQWQLWVHRFKG